MDKINELTLLFEEMQPCGQQLLITMAQLYKRRWPVEAAIPPPRLQLVKSQPGGIKNTLSSLNAVLDSGPGDRVAFAREPIDRNKP